MSAPVDLGLACRAHMRYTVVGRSWWLLIIITALRSGGGFPAEILAQELSTIAGTTREQGEDRIPDRLGETVVLEGVLTTDPYPTGSTETRAYLQDSTGGLRLRTEDRLILAAFQQGDQLRVSGVIGQYRGTELLEVETAQRIGTGRTIEPRLVSVSDLVGERFSGELVRVRARVSVGFDLELVDDTGEVLFYVRDKFFVDPTFREELTDQRSVEVVGIAEQYDRSAPFVSGYRLMPRDRGDIRFEPPPPNWAALSLAFALVASVFLTLLIWRNAAERRASDSKAVLVERQAIFDKQRTFLADAGHEIRTPITILRGDIDVALLRGRSRAEYEAILRRTRSDLVTVSRLADDLITLARTDRMELVACRAQVDVGSLLIEVSDFFRSAALGAGVRFEVSVEPDLFVEADQQLLGRAIRNLADNALKYGGSGGIVRLAAETTPAGLVQITVADCGPGIAPADRGDLFERFYRGDSGRRVAGGSGLGLPIAQAVMELHDGGIEVRQDGGSGATFVLWLAATESPPINYPPRPVPKLGPSVKA